MVQFKGVDKMINDLFHDLPFDNNKGMPGTNQNLREITGFLKQNVLPIAGIIIGLIA